MDGLCGYVAQSLAADLVLVIEGGAQGKGAVLAPESLRGLRGLDLSFTTQDIPLPSALSTALGGQLAARHWQALPHLAGSGILVLWRKRPVQGLDAAALAMLAAPFAALIAADAAGREEAAHRLRFEDLFDSVSSGIVLFDGEGREAYVNALAASYLGCGVGAHHALEIAPYLRSLRERCDNVAEVNAAYAAQLADPDYSLTLPWRLPGLTLEVDTHPLRGDGRNGRLWLFSDITARTLIAEHLQRLAALDPLTDMPNRRHFDERCAQILAAAEASGQGVGIMIVDIDYFKKVNDTYGHATGDLVLRTVANRCRSALREHDLFARFGGEEFVGLISLTAEDDLVSYAERLRQAVAAAPVQTEGRDIPITVSIGTAFTTADGPSSVAVLLEQADAALYRAKAEGRNRVRAAA